MDAARTCETLVNFHQTTWYHKPEDINLDIFSSPNIFDACGIVLQPSRFCVIPAS
jgi:hypothetical protein